MTPQTSILQDGDLCTDSKVIHSTRQVMFTAHATSSLPQLLTVGEAMCFFNELNLCRYRVIKNTTCIKMNFKTQILLVRNQK